jgi:beta-glucosidase
VDAAGQRVVEPGEFELLVGASSRDSSLLGGSFTVTRG